MGEGEGEGEGGLGHLYVCKTSAGRPVSGTQTPQGCALAVKVESVFDLSPPSERPLRAPLRQK